jgi:predicted transcriptional regulator
MTKSDPKTELLAAVAASYAARPDVTADDIVALVAKLRHEFGEIDPVAVSVPAQPRGDTRAVPAVPIDKAVTQDKVVCLCCGKSFKMLKRHLGAEHGLTEAAYRNMFGLSEDVPLVAPSYSVRKSSYARKVGFGKYDRTDTGAGRLATEKNESLS